MRIVLLSSFVLAFTTLATAWYRHRNRRMEPFRRSFLRPIQYRVRMRLFPTYIETTRVWNSQPPEQEVVPLRQRRRSTKVSTYIIDLKGVAVNPEPNHSALRIFLGLIELHFRASPALVLDVRYETQDWSAQARISNL